MACRSGLDEPVEMGGTAAQADVFIGQLIISKKQSTGLECGASPSSGAPIIQVSSPAFELFDDDIERRSFAFFRLRTVPEISGFFPSDFWDRLIPLASFYEPALKHAVIALASLHERFENGDESILKSNDDLVEGGFALQQYNKAIRQLITPSGKQSKPSLDTSLVACVLFACFELLGTWPMDLPLLQEDTLPGFTAHIPPQFHSLAEARNSLDYQKNLCVRQLFKFERAEIFERGNESQEHRDVYNRYRRHHKKQIEHWTSAFQAFLDANVDKMDGKARQGALVLKMSARLAAVNFGIDAYDYLHLQTSWDDQLAVHEELIDMATVILDAQDAPPGKGYRVKPIFQMDHILIGNLFGIVHRCRDPYLRRRAIALLYKVPRQEGIWNSELTARCAERIMQIEEDGLGVVTCAKDIPDWARISSVDVMFDPPHRRGCIKFSRQRSFHSTVREPVTDFLEW
ncbi:MAG: hypothetical protein Q9185_006003 [Variospora sp. 1 TL-2023]